jgi:hypothetical protein
MGSILRTASPGTISSRNPPGLEQLLRAERRASARGGSDEDVPERVGLALGLKTIAESHDGERKRNSRKRVCFLIGPRTRRRVQGVAMARKTS